MIYIYLVFWLPALVVLGFLLSEIYDKKRFFEKALTAPGKLVGVLGAQHKRVNTSATQSINNLTSVAGAQILPSVDGKTLAGSLLLVEFEAENGYIYQTRSKQSFNEIPDEIYVQYDPDKPSNNRINGYYSNNSVKGRIIGMVILIILPIVLHFLMG